MDDAQAVDFIRAGLTPALVEWFYQDAKQTGTSVKNRCQLLGYCPLTIRALGKRWGIRVRSESTRTT